jgi:hypothetical protein
MLNGTEYSAEVTDIVNDSNIRLAISFANGGILVGVSGKDIVSSGIIASYTAIPALDIITTNPNNITVADTQSLSASPVLEVSTLTNPNSLMDDILTIILPSLMANVDNSNTITSLDTSLGGQRAEILGIGGTASALDKLYVCCGNDNIPTMDCMISRILYWDQATNNDQISFLINKYTSMYRHRY